MKITTPLKFFRAWKYPTLELECYTCKKPFWRKLSTLLAAKDVVFAMVYCSIKCNRNDK